MGQKVNPKIFRMGITRTWDSKWFGEGKDYIDNLQQDIKVRKFLIKELREAGVDRIEIDRNRNKITVGIFTAKPGLIIGRGGSGAEDLKKKIHSKFLKNFKIGDISLNITEVGRPNLSAMIVTQSMILEIEKRVPFRRVMKQVINRVERSGALGVKVMIKGRLNGAEIARGEVLSSGKIPLHTMRADIDYARGTAATTYGAIGIKVWIYKGEVFEKSKEVNNRGEVVGKR
ncbi:MAG: 30S ribosomal protein S3 [Parcubacteria group bacterium GW2011_GWE2_38_18]|nr:MAG: 30S ribosomal protein S3 [Parcubacteria group bacterium GW2011_GWE2_38_18]